MENKFTLANLFLKIFLISSLFFPTVKAQSQFLYSKNIIHVNSWNIETDESDHKFYFRIDYNIYHHHDLPIDSVFWYVRLSNLAGEEITKFRKGILEPCPLRGRKYNFNLDYTIPFWSVNARPGLTQNVTVELVPFHLSGRLIFAPVKIGEYKLTYPDFQLLKVRVDELTINKNVRVDEWKAVFTNPDPIKGHKAPDPYWVTGNRENCYYSDYLQDSYVGPRDTAYIISSLKSPLIFKVMDDEVLFDEKIFDTTIAYPGTQPNKLLIKNRKVEAVVNYINLGGIKNYIIEDIQLENINNKDRNRGRQLSFTFDIPPPLDTIVFGRFSNIKFSFETAKLDDHRFMLKYFIPDDMAEHDQKLDFYFKPSIPSVSIFIPEADFERDNILFTDWQITPTNNFYSQNYGFDISVKYSGLLSWGGDRLQNCVTSYSYYYKDSLLQCFSIFFDTQRPLELTLDNLMLYGSGKYSKLDFLPALAIPAKDEMPEFRIKGGSTCTWKDVTFKAGTIDTVFLFKPDDCPRKKIIVSSLSSKEFDKSNDVSFYYSIDMPVSNNEFKTIYKSPIQKAVKKKVIWENKDVPYYWMNANQQLQLSIYNESGKLLFRQNFSAGKTFGKKFEIRKGLFLQSF